MKKRRNNMKKHNMILFCVIAIIIAISIQACNVTRTVTTKAEHYQRGDTTTTIITKTTESYDGAIKRDNFLK